MQQGYFYGGPRPYEESMQRCREQGMEIETKGWRDYYREIGQIDLQTDEPLSIVEFDGRHIEILYNNEALHHLFIDLNAVDPFADRDMAANADPSVVRHHENFLARFRWADEIGKTREETLTNYNHLIRYSITCIAKNENYLAFTFYLHDLVDSRVGTEQDRLEAMFQSLAMLYDNILIVHLDPDEDYLETRFVSNFFDKSAGEHYLDVRRQLMNFCEEMIEPEDQARFLQDNDLTTVIDRLDENDSHSLTFEYRMLNGDEGYTWKEENIVRIPNSSSKAILIAFKESVIRGDKQAQEYSSEFFEKKNAEAQKMRDVIEEHWR
ncbi:MAG: hypothetical protein ACOYJJ_04820 [Anaerovoracaceae bacterium]|jgi:hypothetical protein